MSAANAGDGLARPADESLTGGMPPALVITYVCTVRFETISRLHQGFSRGSRILVSSDTGAVAGPRFSGQVVHASDWAIEVSPGRLELDVRAELTMDSGTVVLLTYRGIAQRRPDGSAAITAYPRFDAPVASDVAWLNDLSCVATGTAASGLAEYHVYAFQASEDGASLRLRS